MNALLNAIGKDKVTLETTLEELVDLVMPTKPKKLEIKFTDEDWSREKPCHKKPFHLSVRCLRKRVLMVLVDNVSASNNCPLMATFKPFNQGVRAYDNTWKSVIGII